MNSNNGTFIAPQIKSFEQKIFKFHAWIKKCHFCNFSEKCAVIVRPSQDFKILFAFGADEFLVMLEGRVREAPLF